MADFFGTQGGPCHAAAAQENSAACCYDQATKPMAANPIEDAFDGLMLQSQRSYNGASALGATIPVVINTAALISAERTALRTAQNLYRGNRGDLDPLYATLRTAMADSRVFCTRSRDSLKKWCGNRFNNTWIPTGFTKNTRIPQNEAPLTALVEDLGSFYTVHTDHEVPDLGVTAAAALALLTRLQNARAAIDTMKMTCVQCREDRDTKLTALRKRLSGLCKELSQRLGPLDGRWRDFGFNLPGASATPPVPKNVTVDNHTPSQFLVRRPTRPVTVSTTNGPSWTRNPSGPAAPQTRCSSSPALPQGRSIRCSSPPPTTAPRAN